MPLNVYDTKLKRILATGKFLGACHIRNQKKVLEISTEAIYSFYTFSSENKTPLIFTRSVSVRLSLCYSVYLSVCLSLTPCLSITSPLSTFLSLCLFVPLFFYVNLSLCLYVTVCLLFSLSLSPSLLLSLPRPLSLPLSGSHSLFLPFSLPPPLSLSLCPVRSGTGVIIVMLIPWLGFSNIQHFKL